LPEDLFRPQLGAPHHYAYVVEDIEATVKRLVDQLGGGPFFLIESVPLENVVSRGEPAEFVHNSAFGSCGGGAIELIETVSLAPERAEKAFSAPRPRVQHVGYVVPPTEVADLRSSLEERSMAQYLSSQLGGVETTLHDASAAPGPRHRDPCRERGSARVLRDGEGRRRAVEWLGTAAPGPELIAGFQAQTAPRPGFEPGAYSLGGSFGLGIPMNRA